MKFTKTILEAAKYWIANNFVKKEELVPPPQSDWEQKNNNQLDYIKNKPFYVDCKYTICLEETIVSSTGYLYISQPSNIVDHYRLTFDNDIYYSILVPYSDSEDDYNDYRFEIYPTDIKISIRDSSPPYLYIDIPEELSGIQHSVKLEYSTNVKKIKKIPNYFLPFSIREDIENSIVLNSPYNQAYNNSVAEGMYTSAGNNSHAEGNQSYASGWCSHAEGNSTGAYGNSSHAEGAYTMASADYTHAEGYQTYAPGRGSHVEGLGTEAKGEYQHVQGKYNIVDNNNIYAHIVGNGSFFSDSNAHTLDWEGNAWYAGDVYVGSTSGTNKDNGSVKLARISDIPDLSIVEAKIPTTPEAVGADPAGSALESLVEAKSYTDTAVAALVNSAPETLDTLGELATAFEENADMVATLNAAVTNKAERTDLDNHAKLVDLNATNIESLQAQVLPTSLILADAITGKSYTIQIQNGQLVNFETPV